MCTNKKEDEDMRMLLKNDLPEIKLNREKLKGRIETLKADERGVILLDRNNPDHREWFEEDDE